jgi:hypothetical protein
VFRGVFGASKETLERDGSSPLREWYRLVFHLAAVYDIHGERVFSGNLFEGNRHYRYGYNSYQCNELQLCAVLWQATDSSLAGYQWPQGLSVAESLAQAT